MSYIACQDPCIYQDAGLCRLERAVSFGQPDQMNGCAYYLPKTATGTWQTHASPPERPV